VRARLPSRWVAPGWDAALASAERVAGAVFSSSAEDGTPTVSVPGWTVVKARPMRVVLRGRVEGTGAATEAFLKAHRPVTALDRAKRLVEAKGPAEGSILLDLRKRGVAVPGVLGWSATPEGHDLLLTAAVEGARSLEEARAADVPHAQRVALEEAVGALLRRAHDAGWTDDDVHAGNVVVTPGGPVLVDAGRGHVRDAVPPARRIRLLGAAGHGLRADARSGLRALRAYLEGDRERARKWMRDVSRDAATAARAYRHRRARRARRTGLHFLAFAPAGPGSAGVLARRRVPAAWSALAASLLSGPPPGARPLKADGSVVAARLPGVADEVVLKRFAPRWKDPWRTPRPIRAFRRAYALRVRGVECPEPLLAAADADGAGVYVAAGAGPGAADLHEAARGALALSPARRRAALFDLGRFLRRLHDAEVSHRDLKAPNLVARVEGGRVRFLVVDLEGARPRRGPVPWRRRARDLARLDASVGAPFVSRADRRRVLSGYLAAWTRPPVEPEAFAAWVRADRARKVGPSGRPR
jgi:tRNA A-37 threonylcarbamoyl transferase component Bud32